MSNNLDDLRFPIGEFDGNSVFDFANRGKQIETIEELPTRLRSAVECLSDEQLDTPYRPDGWTIRQVVHHIADSHINSFTRFKLALTEGNPTIRAYDEALWAKLADSTLPIEPSLAIIDGVHARWGALLRNMSADDFERTLVHPESGEWTLGRMLGLYQWHSLHHVGHISGLATRENW